MDIKRNIYRTETEAMFIAGRLADMGHNVIGYAQMNTPSGFWAVDYTDNPAKREKRETCCACGCESYRISDGLCGDCWNETV